jgi:hypothetical protein
MNRDGMWVWSFGAGDILYGVSMGSIESSNMYSDMLFILNYYMLDVLDESEMKDSPLLVVLKMTG